jgi:hypothetical protein
MSIIFWDMMLCSPLSFSRRFGETYRLHLQGRRNKFSTNQQAGGNPTYFLDIQNIWTPSLCITGITVYEYESKLISHEETKYTYEES